MPLRKMIAAVAVLLASATLHAQTIQVNKDNRTIAVTATDKATAEADIAVVHIGFQVFAPDEATAYAQGSERSNAIMSALKKAGVSDKAIQSDDQKIAHMEFNNGEPATDRAKRQFTVEQSWKVRVDAPSASGVLHLAIAAGANESGSIDWEYSDRDGLEAKAAEKALVRARNIAEQMAKGLNAKLGALTYASNQAPRTGLAALLGASMNTESASVSAKATPLPLAIVPETVEESATVYAVFAIE